MESKELLVNVYEIVNNEVAMNTEQGKNFFGNVMQQYQNKQECNKIILDFNDIKVVNTAFLNDAIGKFYDKKEFDLKKCKVVITHLKNKAMIDILEDVKIQAKKKYGGI